MRKNIIKRDIQVPVNVLKSLKNDLNIEEKNLLNNSDLKNVETLPNVVEQEDKLDSKKIQENVFF